MNKEVKNLIERIKMDIENWNDCGCADDDICTDIILEIGQWKTLLDYINQLETNRDEAIRVLKDAGCYDEDVKKFCDDVWEELPYILEILERGKE